MIKTNQMENTQSFNLPTIPKKIEKSKIIDKNANEITLPAEVIEEIDSLDAPNDLKDGFRKGILVAHKNYAQILVNSFKKNYLLILDALNNTVNDGRETFYYMCPIVRSGNTEEEAIQIYRKNHLAHSLVCDLFIEQLSKQEIYKNPRLIAIEEYKGWRIYLTCDIEYPQV